MQEKEIYLVAENIRSLFNVGSLFRCADVFNVKKVYLTGYTAAPEGTAFVDQETVVSRQKREIAKTALGADDWVDWEKVEDTLQVVKKLKKQGVKVYALETGDNTKNIAEFKIEYPCALIVGNEVEGIGEETLEVVDEILSIPVLGKKESLNVGTAAGIGLYQLACH